ncbi:MAG TPA: ABC transporter permease [Vicinamibacterales bacterium]|nr:ABC transporter permease [Vicinamibacterales bacterium]
MPNLKLAARTLFKTPFVTLIAVASLALGIGANAAIFSLFNQLLLRPLPVPQPEQLVNLAAPGPKPGGETCGIASDCDDVFSYPMFRDLERQQTSFTGIAAHFLFDANLSYKGQTLNGEGVLVSGSYFPVLGIQPAAGRLLMQADAPSIGEAHVVVLSHAYWQSRFALNPSVVGEALVVNGRTLTIVGVAPRGFDGTTIGATPKVFVPVTLGSEMQAADKQPDSRRSYWLSLFARLKPGATIAQAHASLDPLYRAIINDVEAPLQSGMSEQTMARFRAKPILVEAGARGQSGIPRNAGPPLRILLGVSAFVLIIACANIANLLLARAIGRAGEMAVRLSIGASRAQLAMQLLTESLLLAACGAAAAVFVAQWTLDLIVSVLPAFATVGIDWTVDRGVLLFTGATATATGLLFGLFPAVHSTRPDLAVALKGQAGQPSGARLAARFRWALATTQIALSMALLVAAGLFAKSLLNISRVDLGADVEHVVTFGVAPALNGYSPQRTAELFARLEDELAALPGVTAVSDALVPLLAGHNKAHDVSVEGMTPGPDTDMHSHYNEVGPGYAQTVGMTLLSGREFTRADAERAPRVAMVNQAFAKKFNLLPNPLGKHIGRARTAPDAEIVGVLRDASYSQVKQAPPPQYFRPYTQGDAIGLGSLTFYARTAQAPGDVMADILKVVSAIDPALPVEDLRTMPEQIKRNVSLDRLITVLSAAFASLATVLAAIGLYGVLAYTVSQRRREIGLRMALGAAPAHIRAMVLRQVGVMTAVGGAIGLAAAVSLGRLAGSLLFKLDGYDPAVLSESACALAAVALLAGLLPAHRAAVIDPMRALRYE